MAFQLRFTGKDNPKAFMTKGEYRRFMDQHGPKFGLRDNPQAYMTKEQYRRFMDQQKPKFDR